MSTCPHVCTELKRARWLNDETIALGLVKYPSLGVAKAEVVTALIAMLHGPLNKMNNQAYASVKSTIQVNPHLTLLHI
jgi:hypothetical protein